MAIKSSIYLNDDMENFVNFFHAEDEDKKPLVYFISLARAFIKQGALEAKEKLGFDEWALIFQAYNGHITTDNDIRWSTRAGHLASLVCDDLGIENLFDMPDVPQKLSIQKIAKLSPVQQLAVVEIARMFWVNKTEYDGFLETVHGLIDKL